MNKYLTLKERFNTDKLAYIIKHEAEFRADMRPSHLEKKDKKVNVFAVAEKYLNKSKDGWIEVSYKQKRGVGRYAAEGALGLQLLPREIRHTISAEYYQDIDVANAHPVFLIHMCEQLKIECPCLREYINNREAIFQDFERHGIKKATAKQVFLALTNGGAADYNKLEYKSELMKAYKKETSKIHNAICKKFSFEFYEYMKTRIDAGEKEKDYNNWEASYVNHRLCVMENDILQCMYSYFGSPVDAVLCFDGIMLDKNYKVDLQGCEKHILKEMGITINLKIKEMNEGFTLPNKLPKHFLDQPIDYFGYHKTFAGKVVDKETCERWLQSITRVNNGGTMIYLTKNKKTDPITKERNIYYKTITQSALYSTLGVDCYIPNINYVPEDKWNAEQKAEIKQFEKKRHRIPELGNKFYNEYLFTSLSNEAKSNRGFIQHAVQTGKIRCVDHIDFVPFLKSNGCPVLDDTFNLFTGFPMECYDDSDIDFTKTKLYKHIQTQMCDSEEEFDHLMSWIADIIQKPYRPSGSAHLFFGQQGTGKDMFAQFIGSLVGSHHSINYSDIGAFFKAFNMEQANKLLITLNEVAEGGVFSKADMMKAKITEKKIRIEPKGIDAYEIRSCARYLLFTNNQNALYVPNDDRRYTMHHIKNTYANNRDYFEKLWLEVEDTRIQKAAFEYFSKYSYREKVVIAAITTKFKDERKVHNLVIPLQFLIAHIEDGSAGTYDDLTGTIVSLSSLYFAYKEWGCKTGSAVHPQKTFKSHLTTLGLVSKVYWVNGKSVRGFKLVPQEVELLFRKYLKTDSFQFDMLPEDIPDHSDDDESEGDMDDSLIFMDSIVMNEVK